MTISTYFPRIQYVLRVEDGFDAAHQVDRRIAVLPQHIPFLGIPDTVLAGNQSRQFLRLFVPSGRKRGSIFRARPFPQGASAADIDVHIPVAGMPEAGNADIEVFGQSMVYRMKSATLSRGRRNRIRPSRWSKL